MEHVCPGCCHQARPPGPREPTRRDPSPSQRRRLPWLRGMPADRASRETPSDDPSAALETDRSLPSPSGLALGEGFGHERPMTDSMRAQASPTVPVDGMSSRIRVRRGPPRLRHRTLPSKFALLHGQGLRSGSRGQSAGNEPWTAKILECGRLLTMIISVIVIMVIKNHLAWFAPSTARAGARRRLRGVRHINLKQLEEPCVHHLSR